MKTQFDLNTVANHTNRLVNLYKMYTPSHKYVDRIGNPFKPSEAVHEDFVSSLASSMGQKEKSRLLLEMDLVVMPTVALLYIFCFIDRANNGSFVGGNSSSIQWPTT